MKTSLLFVSLAAIFILSACSSLFQHQTPLEDSGVKMAGYPCHKMGGEWMGDCTFDEEGNPLMDDVTRLKPDGLFSVEADNLPDARPSEMVYLQDGDTYKMQAGIVKQELGNRVIKRLAYNGQIPGPLLRVEQNAQITLEFENLLDVDTTLHSHGLRLDNAFDGVPDVTQGPIKPGETFTYQLKFPDEGIYWYHPHIREDYTQELGLYGNMLVDPEEPDYWSEVDREEVFILDDILLTENQPAFEVATTTHALMGRFGNTLLLNNEELYQMSAKQHEVIRFYITNVANTRTFRFSIPGVQMKLVGGDVGRAEKETFVDSILLAPAERAVVEAYFPEKGEFEILHTTLDRTSKLGAITIEDGIKSTEDFTTLRTNPLDYAIIRSNIENLLAQEPDASLRLSVEMPHMSMMMSNGEDHVDSIEWEDTMPRMNAMSNSDTVLWKIIDEKTGKENMDIDWVFQQGDLVKVRIFNDSKSMHPMQHPIHFHGQRFVVLARNGIMNDNLQWKDTALVKTGETVDLLVEMSNPGMWMAHCHIAEHLHSGMMFGFTVQ